MNYVKGQPRPDQHDAAMLCSDPARYDRGECCGGKGCADSKGDQDQPPASSGKALTSKAQGAWCFDMEAAPRDGTPLLCIEYDEPEKVVDLHWFRDGGTASSWRGSFGQQRRPIAWHRLPAPPASSGQGGR